MSDIDMRHQFRIGNKLASDAPGRPFARYPGSKNRLAAWLIGHFPAWHDTFVLPFGGMAATLFKKTRSGIEVYNDLSGDVVHLFSAIRDYTEELIEAITYTPWAKASLAEAQQPTTDPVERARRFFCLLWMAHYPYDKWTIAFRRQMVFSRGSNGNKTMVPAAKLFAQTDYLFVIADRLRGVVIENMDAVELIRMYDYDRALFYCDPPYVHSTRTRNKHYDIEMTSDEHIRLAETLNDIEGMAIISGYSSTLYTDLYERVGWQRVDRVARTNGKDKVESIWLNPAVQGALEQEALLEEERLAEVERNYDPQLSLF